MSTITFGSLFAGIGGMDLGLERAGWKCRWQVEIDPFCQRVLAKHWPNVKRYGDIKQLTGTELEPIDAICGGFPCQDLSVAGKRTGIEGSRSGLWFEYARLLGILRPRYVLIENVSGLLVHDAMRRVVGELARLRYVGLWLSLRASDFGASHLRKRVFLVAYRRGEGRWQDTRSTSRHEEKDGRAGWNFSQPDSDHQFGREGSGVAHAASSRRDGSEGQEQRLFGSPLQAARSVDGRGDMGNSGSKHRSRNAESATEPNCNRTENGVLGATGSDATRGILENANPLLREQPTGIGAECSDKGGTGAHDQPSGSGLRLADAKEPIEERATGQRPTARQGVGRRSSELAHGDGLSGADVHPEAGYRRQDSCGRGISLFAPGPADPRWPVILIERPDLAPALESPVRGMAHGIPDWVDGAMSNRTKRLSRLGNAVVPEIAEWIGHRISLCLSTSESESENA